MVDGALRPATIVKHPDKAMTAYMIKITFKPYYNFKITSGNFTLTTPLSRLPIHDVAIVISVRFF